MSHDLDPRTGLRETLPIVFSYFGICFAIGVIAQTNGFSLWLVLLLSLFVYAGSVQFIIIGMLASHTPILAIFGAAFLVNARIILMSLTVAPHFEEPKLWKNILMGSLLTDETFALAMNKANYTGSKLTFRWFYPAEVPPYLMMICASFAGAWLGRYIPNPESLGLDFAIIAMFIGLVYLQINADRTIDRRLQLLLVGFVLLFIYFGMIFIPANLLILVVTLVGCPLGVVLKHVFF